MTTPFDEAIDHILKVGYHNHRKENHSDIVSKGMLQDLVKRCEPLREDLHAGLVRAWYNVRSPGDRRRKVDLFVGEAVPGQKKPDIEKVRIAVEHKSVITAHRNKTSRFDDLKKVLGSIHEARPEAVLVATILVGVAPRVLNVPDGVHKLLKHQEGKFENDVLPRLSSGDQSLWEDFKWAVSPNRPDDPAKTADLFRTLPTRKPGRTHVTGYDAVLVVPVDIDNVNPPSLSRPNKLNIDVDKEYEVALKQICSAYMARWHM